MSLIDDRIAQQGHAQVLVVLKPERRVREAGRTTLDLRGTRDLQEETASDLEQNFSRFANSQQVTVAKELREKLKVLPPARVALSGLSEHAPPKAKSVRYFPNLGVLLGTVDDTGLAALRQKCDSSVADIAIATNAELIRPRISAALAGGPPTGVSWGIKRLKADALWAKGLTGEGVVIGHVDTGVDATHPALTNAIDAFVEFNRMGEQVPGSQPHDSGDHGTHTAGLMVGQKVGDFSFGVAPGAKLASAMVIEGGAVAARLLGGLDWCVGQGAKIVNISLGFPGFDPQFRAIITILRQRNILPVIAVGNNGPLTSRSPGNYREALSVGAIDEFDQIWIDSSSQHFPAPNGYTKPDILGPGAAIWSCVPGGRLVAYSGTSMATPHVAGLAALLWQHRPDAAMKDIEAAILKSATRPAAIASARGNRGVPDALAALKFLP